MASIVAALLLLGVGPAETAEVTHLGVPARDLVTLELREGVRGGCGEEKLEFVRVPSDGTAGSGAFRVPEGRALIATDVEWHYFSGPPSLDVVLTMILENLDEPSKRQRVAESTLRLGPSGVGGKSEHMTTGFLVTPDARLCVGLVNGSIGSPMRLSRVLVRGYLINDR